MTKKTSTEPKKKTKKLSNKALIAIITASIGCLGTICASVVASAFNLIEPIDVLKLLNISLPSQASGGQDMTQAEDIFSIKHSFPCATMEFPADLFSREDKVEWLEQNAAIHLKKQNLFYAPNMDTGPGNQIQILLSIQNKADSGSWINLASKMSIIVRRIADVPSPIDLARMTGCGGEGTYREFTSVPLRSGVSEYVFEMTSSEADFFTLEPGESEIFNLTFTCESPGVYRMDIVLPYSFENEASEFVYNDIRGAVCPNRASLYSIDPGTEGSTARVYDITDYEWNGVGYQLNP